MSQQARHDAWGVAESYELYMGRWSRLVAARFLDWLDPPPGLDWLEVGCGTGALAGAIRDRAAPASLTGVEPSEAFLAQARASLPEAGVRLLSGEAQALPVPDGGADVVVSGLGLNFVPDRPRALAEMRRAARPGGTIAFYVWDYPSGGLAFVDAFWKAAAALDPAAAELAEDRRFAFCTPEGLRALTEAAGLAGVDGAGIEVPTTFRDFDDFWRPFTLGAGPAPGYCATLDPAARARLEAELSRSLPRDAQGAIPLAARAWAFRGSSG
ncbi:class I SAM-dependent methyltransferase [Amaricoccus sp.]|uniref:class I SAM-dependent methyltransferase n=1 Tax=Amaricoccus sp. TaxID=1872485 RepID=UPI001B582F9C|nr:class I SAM-dependent methyltransferase [Amaricoccus sp.]MBP7000751.1 methyltransferase domain-containing protein [Amaricoccus sp.]